MSFKVKIVSEKELEKVYHFLYLTYVKEMKWSFDKNNPSGLRVEGKDVKKLMDDFQTYSTWFGLYLNNDIVGCVRILQPKNNLLELENYTSINLKKENKREINRLAFRQDVLNSPGPVILLKELFSFINETDTEWIFATLPSGNMLSLACNLGFEKYSDIKFKYSNNDLQSVNLIYLNRSSNKFNQLIGVCNEILSSSG